MAQPEMSPAWAARCALLLTAAAVLAPALAAPAAHAAPPAYAAGAPAPAAGASPATGAPAGHQAPSKSGKHHHKKKGPPPLVVSIARGSAGRPVPRGFLGLSFEVGSMPLLAGYADNGDLVTLLRSLGPGVLRLGGVTADKNMAWVDQFTPRPAWASGTIDEADLRGIATLAARSGWHVLLTVNLGHFEPEAAAREAAAAKATLGEWLAGIELGNEPNSYGHQGLREEPWTFTEYDSEVAAYKADIEAAAPGIPIAGPDVSGSSAFETWGVGEVVDQPPALLTGHHYPMSCQAQPAPTITRLLSPEIRALEVLSLQRYMTVAENGEIPFRMDEANTISCGGLAGISNTFASALWATAYVSQAMSMGVAGINLHGHPTNCLGYTPLCGATPQAIAEGQLSAQPEWYALLMLRGLIGDRPLPTTVAAHPQHNLAAYSFLAPGGGLRVVIVNDDPPKTPRVNVQLRAGAGIRYARLLALTAPDPNSTAGVRLGHAAVAPDGSFSQPTNLKLVRATGQTITLAVSPSSAVMLSIPG
jgi:hypothetical protein